MLNNGKLASDILLACLAVANVYYGAFSEHLEGPPPQPQLWNGISHYESYDKLIEGSYPFFMG